MALSFTRAGLILGTILAASPCGAEPRPFDPLEALLNGYSRPGDRKAAGAAPAADASPQESGARLARIQADLSLTADGLETLGQAQTPPPAVAAEIGPFFKDRESSLNALYRTLAVVDYTWALRFPKPDCAPRERRKILLENGDGLFSDAKTGSLSPWLAKLLGPLSAGKTAEQALEQASAATGLSERDYQRQRARARTLTRALASERAVGAARTKLYCERAQTYEALASGRAAGPTAPVAAASAGPGAEAASVLLLASPKGESFRALGAAVLVRTDKGLVVLTDAGLTAGATVSALTAPAAGSRAPGARYVLTIERRSGGVAVGRLDGAPDLTGLKLAASGPAKEDLVDAIGHMRGAGAWTRGRGLVTRVSSGAFLTDAALGPDMRGGAVLNANGELAGLFVLPRPAGPLVAVDARRLAQVLSGAKAPPAPALSGGNGGSSTIVTAASPIDAAGLPAPGSGAITVAFDCGFDSTCGLQGVGGPGFQPSAPSAGPGGGTAMPTFTMPKINLTPEQGEAFGTMIGNLLSGPPVVRSTPFFGIPSTPTGQFPEEPLPPAPVERPKPPQVEKKPKPMVTGVTITIDPASAMPGDKVKVTAVVAVMDVNYSGEPFSKAGFSIDFSAAPAGALQFDATQASTDDSGSATVDAVLTAGARDSLGNDSNPRQVTVTGAAGSFSGSAALIDRAALCPDQAAAAKGSAPGANMSLNTQCSNDAKKAASKDCPDDLPLNDRLFCFDKALAQHLQACANSALKARGCHDPRAPGMPVPATAAQIAATLAELKPFVSYDRKARDADDADWDYSACDSGCGCPDKPTKTGVDAKGRAVMKVLGASCTDTCEGTCYQWGGKSLDPAGTSGFYGIDCSGLIRQQDPSFWKKADAFETAEVCPGGAATCDPALKAVCPDLVDTDDPNDANDCSRMTQQQLQMLISGHLDSIDEEQDLRAGDVAYFKKNGTVDHVVQIASDPTCDASGCTMTIIEAPHSGIAVRQRTLTLDPDGCTDTGLCFFKGGTPPLKVKQGGGQAP